MAEEVIILKKDEEPPKILACPYCRCWKRYAPTESGIHALNTHIGKVHPDKPTIRKEKVYRISIVIPT